MDLQVTTRNLEALYCFSLDWPQLQLRDRSLLQSVLFHFFRLQALLTACSVDLWLRARTELAPLYTAWRFLHIRRLRWPSDICK